MVKCPFLPSPAYVGQSLGKSRTSQESLVALREVFKCFLNHGLSFADLKQFN